MDCEEQTRSVYEQIQEALEQALCCLQRSPADSPDEHDAQLLGLFSLGVAGGLAFADLLPGIRSEALFDDISDAAEQRDPEQVGCIRSTVVARLAADRLPDVHPAGQDAPQWQPGALPMLAVLNEAWTARQEGADDRCSLMAGFLVGLLSEIPWGARIRYRHGSLKDAVLAVHDRNPQQALAWLTAESITARKRQGESKGADPRALLLHWVEDRLAAAYRMTSPMFFSHKGETQEQRQSREAAERAYHDREETSIQRAQHFGKRLAARDDESIRVPRSYSMNRGLMLGAHRKDHPGAGGPET